jgi:hypothetical protein
VDAAASLTRQSSIAAEKSIAFNRALGCPSIRTRGGGRQSACVSCVREKEGKAASRGSVHGIVELLLDMHRIVDLKVEKTGTKQFRTV